MKKILFIILLSLNSPIWADDINDFAIGEVSLGKSLLDYTKKNQISNLKSNQQYSNDKYIRYTISKILEFSEFDFVDVMALKNDPKYIIQGISAAVRYDQLDECLSLKAKIQKEIEKIMTPDQKQETEFPSKQDKTGESMIYGVQYYTKPYPSNEAIMVNCYHMTEKSNINRVLRISVNSDEFAYFIINDAFM